MVAFAVKHIVEDHGPLSAIMGEVKKTPFSYTSKKYEAEVAARGHDVYVIEVRHESAGRRYYLGYCYKALEVFRLAGGGLWEGRFEFKNSAVPGSRADGVYFDCPVPIEDESVRAWLAAKQPGMTEIPSHLVAVLEGMLLDPANCARSFV